MFRRLFIVLVLLVFVGTTASSCILHTHGRGRHPAKVKKAKKSKKCSRSHYWDGKRCRRKGKRKGKGARKHDR